MAYSSTTPPPARCRQAAAAAFAALSLAWQPPAAQAEELRHLAGWWIAIDDGFPALWRRGEVRPAEEVLIVNPDGRVENRVMNFWSGSAGACAKDKVCSDLPAIASARIGLASNTLTIRDRKTRRERLDPGRGEAAMRQAAVTAVPSWTVTRSGETLTLKPARPDGKAVRTFARIDPARLRRLRAAMRISGFDPAQHWRCFLAAATARDPAFAALRRAGTQPVPPGFLDSFLRIASYLATVDAMLRHPTLDDPDPAIRRIVGHETEQLMVEDFSGVAVPVVFAEKAKLAAIVDAINTRVRPLAGGPTDEQPAKTSAPLPVSEAELGALTRVLGEDAETKKLFCRQ